MAEHRIASTLTHLGVLAANPTAFLIVLIYAALWFVFERESFDWHAVATLATCCRQCNKRATEGDGTVQILSFPIVGPSVAAHVWAATSHGDRNGRKCDG